LDESDHRAPALPSAAVSVERDQRAASEAVKFYGQTLDWLEQHHAQYARTTSHDLTDRTPVNAIWKLGGQSIGLARALVELLSAGYTAQTWPTMRAIHEANRLLGTVSDPEEEEITERWLADREVKQREARAAEQRQAERIAEQMEVAGLEPLKTDVGELSQTLYRGMSKAAHHQSSVVDEIVDPVQRTVIYGVDPRPRQRLEFAIFAGALIQEVLLKVGDALCVLYGPDFTRGIWRRC
jgi:hypothetical protein